MANKVFISVLRSAFAAIAISCLAIFSFAAVPEVDYNPGQVIVQLNSPADLSAIATQYRLNPTPIGQFGSPVYYLLQITDSQTPPQVVAAMAGDLRIRKSEVNRKFSSAEVQGLNWTQGRSWAVGVSWAVGGSAKGFARQWFPDRIRLDEAYAAARTRGRKIDPATGLDTGDPVVVAVLDTGIDLTHPAFAQRLVPLADRWDFVDGDNDPSEVGVLHADPIYGHGTHVAGIVSLVVPDAKIMPLRILRPDGSGELWRITAALIWAANHGADVANLSIGFPENNRVLHDLLDCVDLGVSDDGTTFPELGTRRLAVSVAAGNGGNQVEIYPAAETRDGMLSVAASSRYDQSGLLDGLAPFSSYRRNWIDVSAPGEDIVSALPGGRYGVWSGTSMAAPIVAGVAALLKARHPDAKTFPTPHFLLNRVKETAIDKRWGNDNDLPWGEVRLRRVDALCAVTNNIACPVLTGIANSSGFERFLVK